MMGLPTAMKDQKPNKPQPNPDYANLDESELASNQEATVVPFIAGQRRGAVTWVSPVYNMFTKDADTQPGKK